MKRRDYGQLLAKHLGWKLWDQGLTEEIARLANYPKAVVEVREERTDPLYYRLFKSFLRGSYEGSLNAHKLNVVDSESILRITERVVQHTAKTGNSVIVGRGSQQFLRNREDARDERGHARGLFQSICAVHLVLLSMSERVTIQSKIGRSATTNPLDERIDQEQSTGSTLQRGRPQENIRNRLNPNPIRAKS